MPEKLIVHGPCYTYPSTEVRDDELEVISKSPWYVARRKELADA